ncbi:hypothetical protein AJ80_08415 [Polytolypa hystricis UAMH7299]|uniref:F-box domain-containing protein n=1 Tax=Polytolypa hystricis (strain UAMH7299) TaxID=1447883 RepID=A0A2B7X8K2_POLH7|nr:hypothetical protein AJ80_08415 [Polytolypa hystricis UAMH7299]
MSCQLLEMPPELRLQIYTYLLPDIPIPSDIYIDTRLRSDGASIETAILRTCRQIHNEAIPILYCSVPFTIRVTPCSFYIAGYNYECTDLFTISEQLVLRINADYRIPPMVLKFSKFHNENWSHSEPMVSEMRSFRLEITTGWIPVQVPPQIAAVEENSAFWDVILSTTASTLHKLVDQLETVHPYITALDVFIWLENTPGKQRVSDVIQVILQPFLRLQNVSKAHIHEIHCSFASPTERPVDLLNSPEKDQVQLEVEKHAREWELMLCEPKASPHPKEKVVDSSVGTRHT